MVACGCKKTWSNFQSNEYDYFIHGNIGFIEFYSRHTHQNNKNMDKAKIEKLMERLLLLIYQIEKLTGSLIQVTAANEKKH